MNSFNIIKYGMIYVLLFYDFKVSLCFECDFEHDFCDLNRDISSNLNWTRHSGKTPSEYTGPASDHTTGDGHYVYTEASNRRENEGKARLISPLQESGPFCLIFWYSMYGQNIGSLNVYMRTNTSINTPLFTRNHSTITDRWIKGVVSKIAPVEYKVVFEGVVGNGVKGDIAVDDISLTAGMCSVECDFETAFCNWSQDANDNFAWSRHSGQTVTPNTGPLADHTRGNNENSLSYGYYIYIDTSFPRVYGDKARLISPVQVPGLYCLTFWYSMYGRHIHKLNVYIKTGGSVETLLFSKTNDTKCMDWKIAEISFQSASEYEIVIEGVSGHGAQGEIAIDDVLLKAELCHNESGIGADTKYSCLMETSRGNTTLQTTTNTLPTASLTTKNSVSGQTNKTTIERTTSLMTTVLPRGNRSSTFTRTTSAPTRGPSSPVSSVSETKHVSTLTLTEILYTTHTWRTNSSSTVKLITEAKHSYTNANVSNTTQSWSSTIKSVTGTRHFDTTTKILNNTQSLNTNTGSTLNSGTVIEHSDTTSDILSITQKWSTKWFSIGETQFTNTRTDATKAWTKESDLKESSLKVVYIPVIIVIIIIVIMSTVCVLIRRKRRQKELKLYTKRGINLTNAVSMINENICDNNVPAQHSPELMQRHSNDYTEVVLRNSLFQDDIDGNFNNADQTDDVLREDKHIYNHLKIPDKSFSKSNTVLGFSHGENTKSKDKAFLYDTYNTLQTSQLNSDKESLNQENIEVDNESVYDNIFAGGKPNQVNKTDNYSHVEITMKSRDPSYLYTRVTKRLADKERKLVDVNEKPGGENTFEPNFKSVRDNFKRQFALHDESDFTECNTMSNHDYFILEKIDNCPA